MQSRESNPWDGQLLEKQRMDQVFDRLLKKRSEKPHPHSFDDPVIPGLSLNWLNQNRALLLSELMKSISSGNHQFLPHRKRIMFLDKAREMYVASWPDRMVLMRMEEILNAALEPLFSPHLYSFRKGRGAHLALKDLRAALLTQKDVPVFFLKRDISAYGESIQQERLFSMLDSLPHMKESLIFRALLQRAIQVSYHEEMHDFNVANPESVFLKNGLPAGSPLVPVLENFYLLALDRELSALDKKIFYGRYGDDFLFLCEDVATAKHADEKINQVCSDLGLRMKDEKKTNGAFRTQHPEFPHRESFDWLGGRVFEDATPGIRLHRMRELRVDLKKSIYSSSFGLQEMELTSEQQKQVLKRRLQCIIQESFHPTLARLFREVRNPLLLQTLDHQITLWVVQSLAQNFRLKKKKAWREFKSLELQLLHRQWVNHGLVP